MSLLTSVAATVAADGTVTVILGPVEPGRRWIIETLTVTLSTGTGTAKVYNGTAADPGQLIEGTYSGDLDTTERINTLGTGEALTVQWTSATPGAVARVLLRGLSVNA